MLTMPSVDQFETDQLETVEECPWCESPRRTYVFAEKGYPHFQCADCSLIYLGTRLKEEFVPLIYDNDAYHAAVDCAWVKRTGEKRLNLLGPLPPGSRIFEDGAGAAGFLAACQARGHQATGCDLGLDAVRTAKELFDVDLQHGTMTSLGLPDASLDVMANFNLMSHLYEPWAYLEEARRILTDDGLLFIRTGLRDGPMKYVRRGEWSAPEHVFHYTRRALEQMLSHAGFRIERIAPAFDSDFPYFLYRFGQGGNSRLHRLGRKISGYSAFAWTLLKLPKDDVFIFARPSSAGTSH